MVIPVVPYQIDAFTNMYHWPSMGSGDVGAPISCYAYPYITLQYTGTPDDQDPSLTWPILDILGTNEGPTGSCWGIIPGGTIIPPSHAEMATRERDPFIKLAAQGVWVIKPKVRVTPNAHRISLMLVTARPWGFRS